jgi:hypothetical protein
MIVYAGCFREGIKKPLKQAVLVIIAAERPGLERGLSTKMCRASNCLNQVKYKNP